MAAPNSSSSTSSSFPSPFSQMWSAVVGGGSSSSSSLPYPSSVPANSHSSSSSSSSLPQLPGQFRRKSKWSRLYIVVPVCLGLGFIATIVDIQGVPDPDIRLTQDPHVSRFWEYCAADVDGAEASLPGGSASSFTLKAVTVLFGNGDSSPPVSWPGSSAAWGCSPEALPRYWRRNDGMQAHVVTEDGRREERSFAPDFEPAAYGEVESNRCAPDQLTGVGFRQAAQLGRHLWSRYSPDLHRLPLKVQSVDDKKVLASTVGVLLTLLALPEGAHRQDFEAHPDIAIHLVQNFSEVPAISNVAHLPTDLVSLMSEIAADGMRGFHLGQHLLARWCHQIPWPCPQGSDCISVQKGARIIELGESHLLAVAAKRQPDGVFGAEGRAKLARLLLENEATEEFRLVGLRPIELSQALLLLLGDAEMAKDRSMLQPPFSSRIVLELWELEPGKNYYRVLWNGDDVTGKVKGCASLGAIGCGADSLRQALQQPLH
mmetsp:Transcript_71445/g.149314  ORF Transcript_71445/g.149314 Transcript_71445/m.149314 type:complete len:487 (-) Transcript_71445:225-1685(-)|eukprot:CAMPEP_0206457532 /NCGR_PEP_ID=MMETSP0324_2-20121206/23020_1 /ASSEMBLY_ACC=CAM_ASM_000836 /TAXON_ID=2866 /ORGANISM="Crypthecodinium cohnii, Strain Seligo" /LENGTH=486 /DNA_ID=CAMNT_0053928677 /DNA_START=97 /DNA_END=1557 /DNA_ORIENTATION=+